MTNFNVIAAAAKSIKSGKTDTQNALSSEIPLISLSAILLTSVAIPILLKKFNSKALTGNLYRYVWAIAFIFNCYCVSIPGRFDGQDGKMKDGKISAVWKSAFAPSGWAFAIWGVIYLVELLATSYISLSPASWTFGATSQKYITQKTTSLFGFAQDEISKEIGPSTIIVDTFRKASLAWLAGNLYQCLWCYAFRPKFQSYLWLPAALLSLGAISFFSCHNTLTTGIESCNSFASKALLKLIRFPISLHGSWLTAASLLNLNGWAAVSNVSPSDQIALANASAYVAAIFGITYTLYTKDPFIGFTIAWALSALADKTKTNPDVADVTGLVATKALATTETFLSSLLLVVSISSPFTPKF